MFDSDRPGSVFSLCPYHHKLVHDRGYLVAAPPGGVTVYEPEDCDERIRQYLEHAPGAPARP